MPYITDSQYQMMMNNSCIPNRIPNQYQFPQYQQVQQPMQQQMKPQQTLNGQFVDGIDFVKAQNVDMTGNPVFYPSMDRSVIYVKQLSNTGTGQILTYVLAEEKAGPEKASFITSDELEKMKQDIISEISGIKSLFPVIDETPQKRGVKS